MTLRFEEEMKIEEIAQVLEHSAFDREVRLRSVARADAATAWKRDMPERIGDEGQFE